ncbi:VOC family protein [Christiangramia sp. SM2212]|uniref:VOC family protein n=1 Tax=Christiangramia sediminicola TaxID=3073267 RepID=A0ABU1EP05_9FLAO|nr:VOC family protein [Christiangramia sp. SM2212]MDR5589772.1 VOC family protein [Christiangramia sp. SM2212]
MKINRLLVFSNNIEAQLKFYRDLLGFNISNYSENSFEIKSGYSILRFEYRKEATPYHIAFHIPDRQEEEAVAWLDGKRAIQQFNDEKIVDFSNWQAKSVYFYDEDNNIIEFISRRDFSKPESAIFNAENIVGLAEIGLATNNIQEKFEKMKLDCLLDKFDGDLEKFCAIGEASGLVITINKNEKDWFPTGDTAYASDFEMDFEHKYKNYHMIFNNDILKIEEL